MTYRERWYLVMNIGALELIALLVRWSFALPHVIDAALVPAQLMAAFIALGLALTLKRENGGDGMSEPSDEPLFDRMRAVLDLRNAEHGDPDDWSREVIVRHNVNGWGASVTVFQYQEDMDTEECVTGQPTINAALRALAAAVLAAGVETEAVQVWGRNPSP